MKIGLSAILFFLAAAVCVYPQEEISVTTIRVWVAVEGSQKSVGVLTKDSFEVFEDGKKMNMTCFEKAPTLSTIEELTQEESKQETPEDAPKPAEASQKRIILLLDTLNTSQQEYLFIRPKILEFLNEIAGKSEVMLAITPPFEPLVPYTSNLNTIKSKLETINANMERDRNINNNRRDIRMFLQSNKVDQAYSLALELQQQETQEALVFLDSFNDLDVYLNRQEPEDHTVVILISAGINSQPGQQYLDMVQDATDPDEALRSLERGTQNFKSSFEKVIGKLNRNNVTIYSINTRGQINVVDNIIEPEKQYTAQRNDDYSKDYGEILSDIAEDTGGVSFRNSLNFKHGFDAIISDLDHQYLLCYVAPEHKKEGQYHRIKVESKARGVKVRYRKGYLD